MRAARDSQSRPPGNAACCACAGAPRTRGEAFADHDDIFAARLAEADAFYAALQISITDPDARLVQRQALAGMLWSKQFYRYDVRRWLIGDPLQPAPPAERETIRNNDWQHLNNRDIISMPDTWEYPWYASWDLAFQAVTFALIDPEFAKQQLLLLTHEWFMHPNGSLPAYEWAFGDVNPPVHAWAAWRVFRMDAGLRGAPDFEFLERVFHKLMMNFTGWVNRQDVEGRNVFQGGFLGLDNIGVFDRSQKLPVAGRIDQSDGTSWMAMYALNMMRISLELATRNHVYESTATKFFEHFLAIAEAMTRQNGRPRPVGRGRPVLPQRPAAPGWFGHSAAPVLPGRVVSAVRGRSAGTRHGRALPGVRRAPAMGADPSPGPRGAGVALGRGRAGVAAPAVAAARQPDEGAAAADAGRDRVSVALWRAQRVAACILNTRSSWNWTASISASAMFPATVTAEPTAVIRTGADRCGCR